MAGYYININIKTDDAARVRETVKAIFTAEGFPLLSDEPASVVVEDDDKLPEHDDWYGVMITGQSGRGWVSVYVDDWQDSGFLAKRLSQLLATAVLELWVADDIHWGYTYYEGGAVQDRFADDPAQVAESVTEAALYQGQAKALTAVLQVPSDQFEKMLREAHAHTGQFAGGPLDAVAQAVGLPFEHLFTGYDYFFSDDPDDYSSDLENWPDFRHLTFQAPKGRETLSE